MNKKISLTPRSKIAILIILLLLLDQVVKFVVKLNMTIEESFPILGNWSFIRFIENPGAAFGMQIGGEWGKLALSLLRVVAITALIWYLNRIIKRGAPTGVLIGGGMILAGAMGNMIDSAFYGMIFSESTFYEVATLFPEGGGYGSFLHGKVVDMLYFPIIDTTWPDWIPWLGGDRFLFFSPIFNFADSYITIAVIYLIIFQHKYFLSSENE